MSTALVPRRIVVRGVRWEDGSPVVAQNARAVFRNACQLPRLEVRWLDERPRDACGRRRSPATMPGYLRGRTPGNKGKKYPPEPLTEAEVFRLLSKCAHTNPIGRRTRALIVLLWRSGLRIHEALLLEPRDLDPEVGMVHVRRGKGGKAGYSAMDAWAFEQIDEWLQFRARYPHGPIFCITAGANKGIRAVGQSSVRRTLHELGARAGIAKRVHPHGFRHTLACDLMRSGEFPLSFIQHQLRHSNPATTANYLVGLGADHSLAAVAARPAPSFASPVNGQRPHEAGAGETSRGATPTHLPADLTSGATRPATASPVIVQALRSSLPEGSSHEEGPDA